MTTSPISKKLITGVILAGGQSRRMGGGDKFLKEVANKTILSYAIDQFSNQCETILISANGDLSRLEKYNLPIIKDPFKENYGPLAGILAAMIWSKLNRPIHTHIISVAADSPLFPANYTDQMVKYANEVKPQSIILAKSRGRHHPIFGLWPIELADDLKTYLEEGGRKIRAWTEMSSHSSLEFPDLSMKEISIDPFFNINEPKDLKQFSELIAIR